MALRRYLGAFLLLALVSLSFGQPKLAENGAEGRPANWKESVLGSIASIFRETAFAPTINFDQWPDYLKKHQAEIDKADTDEAFQRAVNAALKEFKASHIMLSTPQATRNRKESRSTGIGISVALEKDAYLVTYVFEGSPAAKVGLVAGDRILTVDGKSAADRIPLTGDEGKSVTITVRRRDGSEEEMSLVRRRYSTQRPAEVAVLDDDTAILTLHTFDLTYSADRVEALLRKVSDKPQLIIDLRGNGGGAVANMCHFLNCFLPGTTEIGTYVDRRLANRYERENGKRATDLVELAKFATRRVKIGQKAQIAPYRGKVAVITNGGSGSAAEIAATVLRDELGAAVVGTKTAGAVLISVLVPVGHEFSLQFPLSDYVTMKGQRLEGVGVTPTVPVRDLLPFRISDAEDAGVKAARDWFIRASSG
ncbi:MAG: S41 family peptidase [Fimbriimonadaceae bacterium]|nr:S41 family peptidase [Fimbriimonadaceae bacterium]